MSRGNREQVVKVDKVLWRFGHVVKFDYGLWCDETVAVQSWSLTVAGSL